MDATYDTLKTKFAQDSSRIARLYMGTSVSASYVSIVFSTVKLWFFVRRALGTLQKMERRSCVACDGHCGFPIKKDMQEVVHVMRHFVNAAARRKVPLLGLHQNMLARIEDKLEDYWLATDQETKDLMAVLAGTVHQNNAHC